MLPEWWNPGKLLAQIHQAIDRVVTDNWGKTAWYAVSDLETGLVWVDERLVWKALKAVACQTDIEFLLAGISTTARRDYLHVIIEELGRQGMVAVDVLEEGYHQVPVLVHTAGGRTVTRFLIPFNPSAFGENLADMIARKTPLIRAMVVTIRPKHIAAPEFSLS